ncbi:hypothetical protein EV561_10779 [Rhizobium sp. BK376]|nr:hypothetical protein EV561_10779 [Rhizobium sp. BK376]
MVSRMEWTLEEAEADVRQLLETARRGGPQTVRDTDGKGVFTVTYSKPTSQPSVTAYLLEGGPEE